MCEKKERKKENRTSTTENEIKLGRNMKAASF
jgi:hypothetical protein